MRLLVFGGAGMLGHKVWQVCRERMETWVTLRAPLRGSAQALFNDGRVITGVQAGDHVVAARAIARARPTHVVNCIGIVKQLRDAKDAIPSIRVNALWPHELAALSAAAGATLIHISTDCVFSGVTGAYPESATPDATDLYGRSKLLGELDEGEGLTLRTSIIGRELSGTVGLVEWFLSRRGQTAKGYTRAVFSGLTTDGLARVIADVVERGPALRGLYHVAAAAPINKHDLLCRLRDAFGIDVDIQPDDEVVIDRSLDARRFWDATGRQAPDWPAMIAALAAESATYELHRS